MFKVNFALPFISWLLLDVLERPSCQNADTLIASGVNQQLNNLAIIPRPRVGHDINMGA